MPSIAVRSLVCINSKRFPVKSQNDSSVNLIKRALKGDRAGTSKGSYLSLTAYKILLISPASAHLYTSHSHTSHLLIESLNIIE